MEIKKRNKKSRATNLFFGKKKKPTFAKQKKRNKGQHDEPKFCLCELFFPLPLFLCAWFALCAVSLRLFLVARFLCACVSSVRCSLALVFLFGLCVCVCVWVCLSLVFVPCLCGYVCGCLVFVRLSWFSVSLPLGPDGHTRAKYYSKQASITLGVP